MFTQQEVIAQRNTLKKCPTCNSCIEDRTIALYSGLIKALYQVCKWCQENNVHEFEMRDVRHLLNRNDYARFGDLVRFGGIVYKNGKAKYGINIPRAKAFFSGKATIPLYLTINQITGDIVDKKEGRVDELKNLDEWLVAENKLYDSHSNPYNK